MEDLESEIEANSGMPWPIQAVFGSVAGFATGYLALHFGKKIAVTAGTTLAALKGVEELKLVDIDWDKVRRIAAAKRRRLRERREQRGYRFKDFMQHNGYFLASLIVGFAAAVIVKL